MQMKLPNGLSVVHIDKHTYVGDDDQLIEASPSHVVQLEALGAVPHEEDEWAKQDAPAEVQNGTADAPHPNGDHIIGTPGNS